MQRLVWLIGIVLAAPMLAGCNAIAGEESTKNEPNHFRYSMEGAAGGFSRSWDWDTDSGDVRVSFSVEGASGSAKLVVKDAAGRTVYSESVSGAGEHDRSKTLRGMNSGTWHISLESAGIAGELSVELRTSVRAADFPSSL